MRAEGRSMAHIIEGLRHSYSSQQTRPIAWRTAQLKKLLLLLSDHEVEIQEALFADLRRPKFESYTAEIGQVKSEIRYVISHLAHWSRPQKVSTPLALKPAEAMVLHEPLGVVCIIAPWNYPISLVLRPLVAALAAGNCAVLKPSEHAPNCAELLARLIPQYLGQGFCKVFTGGPETVNELLNHRFDHIFFTGSAHMARKVMQQAANFLTPLTLELGGKSPCIVDKDVDLKITVKRIVWAKWVNCGQTCVAPDYILAHSAIKDALMAELVVALRQLYGDDPELSPDYGRIVNHSHLQRLQALLENQPIVHGGTFNPVNCYFAPTIVDEPDEHSRLMQEEIFGPILPVLEINSLQAAVAKLAAQPKPLALYLFSNDHLNQKIVLNSTSSGGVCINDALCQLAVPELPFGGIGDSGMGCYHGRAGFETFSHKKSVLRRSLRFDNPLRYPPYSKTQMRIAKLAL